jgi:histone deacetylase 1/2
MNAEVSRNEPVLAGAPGVCEEGHAAVPDSDTTNKTVVAAGGSTENVGLVESTVNVSSTKIPSETAPLGAKTPVPRLARDFMDGYKYAEERVRRVTFFHHGNIATVDPVSPIIPSNLRHKLTWELLKAYNLTDTPLLQVRCPQPLSLKECTKFHANDYIAAVNTLSKRNNLPPGMYAEKKARHKLHGINTVLPGSMEQSLLIAGGTMEAAKLLTKGRTDIAINYMGGYHHARMDEASAGCFVNDSVLACLELLTKFDRVLYLNMGYHHSDAVEEAFYLSNRVFHCSFHPVVDPETFPSTGYWRDTGHGKDGKRFNINVPFERGVSDKTYFRLFEFVVRSIATKYSPQVIVCCTGCGILGGSRGGCFNVSSRGYGDCMKVLRELHVPLLILGGTSGHSVSDTAKTWAYNTAAFLFADNKLPPYIPPNPYSDCFFPQHDIHTTPRLVEDENTSVACNEMFGLIMDSLSVLRIPGAIRRRQLGELEKKKVSGGSGYGDDEEEHISKRQKVDSFVGGFKN